MEAGTSRRGLWAPCNTLGRRMVGSAGLNGRFDRNPNFDATLVSSPPVGVLVDFVDGVTRPPRRFLLLTPPVCPVSA